MLPGSSESIFFANSSKLGAAGPTRPAPRIASCEVHLRKSQKELSRALRGCIGGSRMTPTEKLAYIEIQIWACESGEVNALVCPYCGELHTKGAPLCCETFAKACAGVIAAKHTPGPPPLSRSLQPNGRRAHSFY
jgi:hypothetical protein